jgi:hypothetical protein
LGDLPLAQQPTTLQIALPLALPSVGDEPIRSRSEAFTPAGSWGTHAIQHWRYLRAVKALMALRYTTH